MPKYFRFPFAQNGDRQAIPDEPGSTEVSYRDGYTPSYSLPKTDPNRRVIGRQPFNSALYSITDNIKYWQENAFPEYVADDGTGNRVSYPQGAIVKSGGVHYQSIAPGGTITDPPSAEWIVFDGSAYDNTTSGLSAITKQVAIDELSSALSSAEGEIEGLQDITDETKQTVDIPTDADYTLTGAENNYRVINLTSSAITADRNVVVDNTPRTITVYNSTSYNLTVKTAVGAGIAVKAGMYEVLYCDGTGVTVSPSSMIGINQEAIDVSGSRSSGVIYTNTTQKPISVYVALSASLNSTACQIRDNSSASWTTVGINTTGATRVNSYVVPAGWEYRNTGTIEIWVEMR